MARPALAARRAVDIVNLLASHPEDSFTLSELARRTEVNVASAHAILNVLTEAGYLSRDPIRRTYGLGPALIAVGAAALDAHPAVELALAEMAELADEHDMELVVTAAAGGEIVALASAGRPQPHGHSMRVGQRVPLAPPLGSVFLAWADDDEVDSWLDRAPSASDDEQAHFRKILQSVRERGYSIGLELEARRDLAEVVADRQHPREADREALARLILELGHGEYQLAELDDQRTYGVSMIAAPVFDRSGQVELAITLVGFPERMDATEIRRLGERLCDAGLVVTKSARGRLPS